jgi:hypothetical protein
LEPWTNQPSPPIFAARYRLLSYLGKDAAEFTRCPAG